MKPLRKAAEDQLLQSHLAIASLRMVIITLGILPLFQIMMSGCDNVSLRLTNITPSQRQSIAAVKKTGGLNLI